MNKNLKKFNEIKDFKKHSVKPLGSLNLMGEPKSGAKQKKLEDLLFSGMQKQKKTKIS